MPRQSKLREKKVGKTTNRYTKTGGETDFSNIDSMPYPDAKKQFNQHVISVTDPQKNAKTQELTAGELMDFFLDWIEKHRTLRFFGPPSNVGKSKSRAKTPRKYKLFWINKLRHSLFADLRDIFSH